MIKQRENFPGKNKINKSIFIKQFTHNKFLVKNRKLLFYKFNLKYVVFLPYEYFQYSSISFNIDNIQGR